MGLTKFVYGVGRWVSKHSPEILTGLGIVGVAATAVTTYKSAGKVQEIVENVEEAEAKGIVVDSNAVIRDVAVAMALPISLGIASVGCFLWSWKIQNGRIQVLSGAVSALATEYARYKRRYSEIHGDEEARKFFANTEQEVSVEDGESKIVEKVAKNRSLTGAWLSDSSEFAEDDMMLNMAYLDESIKRLDLKLFQKGVITLNDLYDELDMPISRQGALLGFRDLDIKYEVYDNLRTEDGLRVSDIYVSWNQPEYIFK